MSAALVCPNCKARVVSIYEFAWCADCCPYPIVWWYRNWVWCA